MLIVSISVNSYSVQAIGAVDMNAAFHDISISSNFLLPVFTDMLYM